MIIFLLLGFIVGIIFSFIWVYIAVKKYKIEKHFIRKSFFKKYHIHHSMFVPLFLFLALIAGSTQNTLFLIGFSSGILIKHTINDGFVFISKN